MYKNNQVHIFLYSFKDFLGNQTSQSEKWRENPGRNKNNSQKASSGDWEALRLTLTITGLASAGLDEAEELSPIAAIDACAETIWIWFFFF